MKTYRRKKLSLLVVISLNRLAREKLDYLDISDWNQVFSCDRGSDWFVGSVVEGIGEGPGIQAQILNQRYYPWRLILIKLK